MNSRPETIHNCGFALALSCYSGAALALCSVIYGTLVTKVPGSPNLYFQIHFHIIPT